MKNVYKYILMFLSVASYIARLNSLLKEVKKKKIMTPDGYITPDEVIQNHKAEFDELTKESSNKLEGSISKYKSVLEKQIIIKIMGTYMQRPEEKSIIQECGNLLKLLQAAKDGEYQEEDVYMSLFRNLIEKEGIHFKLNIVKEFKSEDVKVYMYMRLIAQIDDVLRNTFYKNDDYLRARKQHFENASKEENL